MNNNTDSYSYYLSSEYVIIDQSVIWIYARKINSLISISIEDNSILDIFEMPNISDNQEYRYSKLLKVEEYLYVFPGCANSIYRFNTISKNISEVHKISNCDEGKYKNLVVGYYQKKVLWGLHNECILYQYDTVDEKVKVYKNFREELEAKGYDMSLGGFRNVQFQDGNVLYIPISNSNLVLSIDMENMNHVIYAIKGIEHENITFLTKYKRGFIFTTNKDKFVYWIPGSNADINYLNILSSVGNRGYQYICYYKDTFFLVPRWERKIVCLSNENIDTIDVNYSNSDVYTQYENAQYDACFTYNNCLYCQERSTGQFIKIDMVSKSVERQNWKWNKDLLTKYRSICKEKNNKEVIYEEKDYNLIHFVNINI